VLERVLSKIETLPDANVLVGFDKADDAGVYLLNEQQALVQTIDFFTPVVDDPRTYGQIAAANALSDVYAMGARPLIALSVLAFPDGTVDEESLLEVIQGGTEKMREAGVPVIGGHSIQDREMKFGYGVTGLVDPARIVTNAGALPGDELVLTKPVGTGIITTGIKFGRTPEATRDRAVAWMLQLNEIGTRLHEYTAHAATDITGYGLLGHAYEMARASGVTFRIEANRVPVIEGTEALVGERMLPGGIEANRRYVDAHVSWGEASETRRNLLLDPQTSGGLLVSLASREADSFCSSLKRDGLSAWKIGEVTRSEAVAIRVF